MSSSLLTRSPSASGRLSRDFRSLKLVAQDSIQFRPHSPVCARCDGHDCKWSRRRQEQRAGPRDGLPRQRVAPNSWRLLLATLKINVKTELTRLPAIDLPKSNLWA